MKNLFKLVFILIVAGCATTGNYVKILNTWVGAHVDNLIISWGPPQRSYELSDGGKVLEYSNSRNVQMGGYTYTKPQTTYHSGSASAYDSYGGSVYGTYSGTSTTYVQKQSPKYISNLNCTTRFTTDSNGIIIYRAFQGNNCKALPPK